MKITEFDIYRDGGTIKILTDEGNFFFDHRIGTTEPSRLCYDHYPSHIDRRLVELTDEIKGKLVTALNNYPSGFYIRQVTELIEELKL